MKRDIYEELRIIGLTHDQCDKVTDLIDNQLNKMRKALETIRDSNNFNYTHAEKVADLKAIAFNVLYEIDNDISFEE